MPNHRYFSGPYNTRTFKRSLNADTMYNNNTPPQTQRQPSQPQSSQPRSSQPGPSQPRSLQTGPMNPGPAQPRSPQPGHSQPGHSQPGHSQPGPSNPGPSQRRSPQPGPSKPRQLKPGPSQSRLSQPGPSEPEPRYFVPTQSYYNSCYNCNYQEFEYAHTGYDQEYTDYEYQPVPTFYLHVDVYEPTEGLVCIYLSNLDAMFVPEDYFDETLLVYMPPEIEQDLDGQVLANFIRNRLLYFLPEDAKACLSIVEALMPLQIATKRLPGFFQIVKKPVILGNIKHTILDGKYNRLVDVIHDLRAIVWNIDYYLSQRWEDLIEGDNDLFSLVLEGQLEMYYPDLNLYGITGDPDNKPE